MSRTGPAASTPSHGSFAATHWSVVLAAAQGTPCGEASARALAELCRVYWYPLYAYVRRRGFIRQDAEDLTQAFLARLLERRDLASIDRGKGKFRSFLLASLQHFLANEWDKARAQKRGGGVPLVALDALAAEARYAVEPVSTVTPERLFEKRWALAVLEQVLTRLEAKYQAAGQRRLFAALRESLTTGTPAGSQSELARELGISLGALQVAAHRLRRNYRKMLREEIAQTVAAPELIDDEIRYLLNCL